MPCLGPTGEEIRSWNRREGRYGELSAGEMSAVICGLLRTGKVALDDVDWAQSGVEREWVEQWWSDHQEQDRCRGE